MAEKLKWGIIGCGSIAKTFAHGLEKSKTGQLSAVSSRTREKAEQFGNTFNVARCYGSYEDLLSDDDVEAVYIATPHPMHAEWAIKTAEAKKHVLCEKPIGLNHAEAMAIVEAAFRNDVFLMEAFMYRCHPQTRKLVDLIRRKAVGEVRLITATFSFHAAFDPESRLFNNALGGGGILDVGGYCTSMARLVAGAALDMDFAEPEQVNGCACIGEQSRIDEYAIASLRFPGNILAQLSTGVRLAQDNAVRIYGTEGNILVTDPWIPSREGGVTKIIVNKKGVKEAEEITIETGNWLYAVEADTVAKNIENRQAQPPAMTWDDTLGNMKTLDMWREAIGLVYDREKPEAQVVPVHGRKLAVSKDHFMKYGDIKGIDKPVSRLVMGVDNQTTMPHAAVMFDYFIEQGGTCFDSAFVYGGGACEKILGQWIKNRNIREQVVILDKGAHTPYCYPEAMTKELMKSLERLQTDYIDIYMLHRDNPDIPVGEFIDALNEHKAAGRMRVFGGSNWSLERVKEANEYAAKKGIQGFTVVSNNFSLARMVDPVWGGCIASSEPEYRAWLTETQRPLMPWSSQARGFFVPGRAHPDKISDKELVRCWYSKDNFRRLERAKELAEKYSVSPISIALAYVLCQPFPTFPLIGPRKLSETRASFAALGIELSPDEIKWLNLEE